MVTKIKDLPKEERVLSGNGSCAGCPAVLALRIVSKALGANAIMVLTPSCSVASMGILPKMAFNYPALNVCFATAGSSAAGISYALESLQKKGKLAGELPTVFNWVGDGGTYDIGLQALSAAAERNDNILHICYNNEAYSNTGMQRSGATPKYASTTTTPGGKTEFKKSMPLLMLDHNIPYMATAAIDNPGDLYDKVVKAKSVKGFKYIEIFAPCYTGWRFPSQDTVHYSRLGVQAGAWLLWEGEYGKITNFNGRTALMMEGKVKPQPIEGYLQGQGRFKDIFQAENSRAIIDDIQQNIWRDIEFMKKRAAM